MTQTITKSNTTQAITHQEHKNAITAQQTKKTKEPFTTSGLKMKLTFLKQVREKT